MQQVMSGDCPTFNERGKARGELGQTRDATAGTVIITIITKLRSVTAISRRGFLNKASWLQSQSCFFAKKMHFSHHVYKAVN